MKILYEVGNLIESPHVLLIHGCNAQGVMGSGVAKAIRSEYPHAYEVYRAKHIAEGLDMGEVLFVPCDNRVIANAVTQEFYGRDGKQYVDYDSINKAMELVNQFASTHSFSHVALPLIGAGYGGGSWAVISEIIEDCLTETVPVVYTLDGRVPIS